MIATHLVKFFLEGEPDAGSFSGFTTHPALWAFDGFTPSDTPPPDPTPTTGPQTGAGKSRRRRWQAERNGVVEDFATAEEAMAFVREVVEELKPKVRKPGRPKKILPPIELFYEGQNVTDVVIDKKPVLEWFVKGPDVKTIETALLRQAEEDDDIMSAYMEEVEEVKAYVRALRRMLGH